MFVCNCNNVTGEITSFWGSRDKENEGGKKIKIGQYFKHLSFGFSWESTHMFSIPGRSVHSTKKKKG